MADFEFTYDESLEIFYSIRDRRFSLMKQLDDGVWGIKKHSKLKNSFDNSLSVLDKFQKAFDLCQLDGKKTCKVELHPFKTCIRVSMEDC